MMRSLITILALVLAATVGIAQGIDFFHGSYEEALASAEEQGKLVFVDAYAVWCGPCKRMSNQVFPREDVGTFFNENFVALKIDMEKGPGKQFAKKFPVSSYPTLLFINSNGELVQRVIGAQSPENLIMQGQLALRKTDKSETFAKRYNEGDRDPKLVFKYVESLNKAGKPSLAVANEFLRDNTDYSNPDVQAVIFEGTRQADSRVFKLFIEQREALEATYGATAVAERIEAACERTMKSALTYNSANLMEEANAAMAEHLPSRAKIFTAKAEMAKAKNTKDSGLAYKAAKKLVLSNGNTPTANHAMAVELSSYFADQPKAMALAAKMAGTAAKGDPSFDHLFTYAQLLAATGKGKKAKSQAERAMQKLGENDDPRRAAMVNELLEQLQG